MTVSFRPASACAYDLVSLGEVMLRLDPGDGRVRTARQFRVWEGGGEYNVARGLRRCFGLRTAVVTALCDNDIRRLIEDLMLAGGVDLRFVRWVQFDGVGRQARNGLNFTERGFGVRGAVGVSDRRLAGLVDILLGNEEDFTACLGFEVPGTGADLSELEIYDRVGGGDSFASGLLYGLLELGDLRAAVEYGAAHGALAMTTPGDTSAARLDEVRKLVHQPSARIVR